MSKTVYRDTRQQYDDEENGYYPAEEYPAPYTDEEAPSGLFSTPGRAAALLGSLVLLVSIVAVAVWVASTRTDPPPNNSPGNVKVPIITSANASQKGEAPAKGSVAPDFEWTDSTTGQPVKLSELSRTKPVFINFWGTWCPPCRAEMPEMQRLYNQHKGEMEFIGVSMGPRDNAPLVAGFVNNAGYNWLFLQDDTYQVATRYQVQAVPSSYFIGTDGVIKAVHVGGMNGAMMESYLQQVK